VGLVPLPDAEIQKALQAQVLSETQDASIFSGTLLVSSSFTLCPTAFFFLASHFILQLYEGVENVEIIQ
jgi:hypothetical protein